jgi:hypothetical protein
VIAIQVTLAGIVKKKLLPRHWVDSLHHLASTAAQILALVKSQN